jgi:hypothetical protein
MELIRHEDVRRLLEAHDGPCLTLYVPGEINGKSRIHWKTQVGEAMSKWTEEHRPEDEKQAFFRPLLALEEDAPFWGGITTAVAAYRTRDDFKIFRVPTPVHPVTILGDRFAIKPVLPALDSDGAFRVLALSHNAVRLWHATRWNMHPVEVPGMPKDFEDGTRHIDRDEPLNFHTEHASSKWAAIFHGHGVGIDDHKSDLLAYFRKIDAALHPLLRNEKAPLVLAAVASLVPIYREANRYPHLLNEFVAGSPDRVPAQELHAAALAVVRPMLEEPRQRALDQYRAAEGTGYTSHDVAEILPAAMNGELSAMFVPLDRECWGKREEAGVLITHGARRLGDEDLLDVAAAEMMKRGRTVYSMPAAEIPGGAGVAALRFIPLPKHGKRPGAAMVKA